MDIFNEFCNIAKVSEQSKLKVAVSFMWFHQFKTKEHDVSIKELNQYFVDAHLSAYNPTYLKRDLSRSTKSTKGVKKDTYKLSRKALDELNTLYLPHLNKDIAITEQANINITPYLSSTDIDDARKMAELYIILHCFENSVRNFIEDILTKKIGKNWWDTAKNKELEQKIKERKDKEAKNKWLSPRGKTSLLLYLDWGDLVKIIRKFESDFNPHIDEVKFVELRLEELEKIRNIVAHNGVIPSKDDFDRVVLHFKDWCNQLK
jgi:Swt1-like HEPN